MMIMMVEDFLARYQKVLEQLETLVKIDIVTVKKNVFQRMGIKQWDEGIVQ
jgi:hypothetical protein